jgi:SAM-dependent methyltransferase
MSKENNGFSAADFFLGLLDRCGYKLKPGARILDLGCGHGQEVYEFRDRGFEAYGIDLHNVVAYRSETDGPFFKFMPNITDNYFDCRYEWKNYRLPFEDESFDFIYSQATFEHIMNYEATLEELHRVMKPGSVSLHTFPPKFSLLEPHTLLPFGSVFSSYPYCWFWTRLGFRSEVNQGKMAGEAAAAIHFFLKNGLNYLSPRRILKACKPYFPTAEFRPEFWSPSRWLRFFPPYRSFFTHCKYVVLKLDRL